MYVFILTRYFVERTYFVPVEFFLQKMFVVETFIPNIPSVQFRPVPATSTATPLSALVSLWSGKRERP